MICKGTEKKKKRQFSNKHLLFHMCFSSYKQCFQNLLTLGRLDIAY